MAYDDCVARIEKLVNGYEVEVLDPDIQKSNRNSKNKYQEPWKGYAFTTKKEVVEFLSKVLDTLKPGEDDMATNFQRAIEEDDDD